MVDNNGHRSVPTSPEREQPTDYAGAVAEVGSAAVKGMQQAEKGWILAAVVLFLGGLGTLEITNYLETANRLKLTNTYFAQLETNRSQENRRLQEQNKACMDALSRQSDNISRQFIDDDRKLKAIKGSGVP